jgi:hypothetical protein
LFTSFPAYPDKNIDQFMNLELLPIICSRDYFVFSSVALCLDAMKIETEWGKEKGFYVLY